MLLEGDEKRFQRGEPCLGFGDATTAPDWAKARIIEIRSAVAAKRPVPAPSPSFVRAAETRSAALGFGRSLLRSNPVVQPPAWKIAFVEKHFPRMTAAEIQAHRLKRQGEAIQADAAAARSADELEADIRQVKREMFPWEQ